MPSDAAHEERPARDLRLPRPLLLPAAVLLAEGALLVSRFSAHAIRSSPDVLHRAAFHAWYVSFLALAVLAAVVALGGASLRAALARPAVSVRLRPGFLVLQGAAFAAFYALTAFVFEGPFADSSLRLPAFAGWLLSGALATLLALLAAAPAAALLQLVRALPRLVWLAAGVGLLAGAVGLASPWVLWRPLGAGTLRVAHGLLALFTDQTWIVPDEFFIGGPAFVVKIVPQCSGYEGIGLVWIFVGGYLWLFRRELRWPHAWLLLLLATVVVWLANAARIAALVGIGNWISGDLAAGGFHSKVGWILFCGVALGTVALSRRLEVFGRRVADRGALSPATAALLLPLLTYVGLGLMTGAASAGAIDRLYAVRIAGAVLVLQLFRGTRAADASTASLWRGSGRAVVLGLLAAAVWGALLLRRGDAEAAEAARAAVAALGSLEHALWWLARVAGFVLVVPAVEELAFRAYLPRRLLSSDFTSVPAGRFTPLTLAVSSLAFGALHHDLLAGTAAGAVFALAMRARGRVADAVLAHAVANAALLAAGLASGRWELWL